MHSGDEGRSVFGVLCCNTAPTLDVQEGVFYQMVIAHVLPVMSPLRRECAMCDPFVI